MTPQFILRKSLCRPAHCFSAHVPGQGYVNDGSHVNLRAEYDRQRRQRAESEIGNLQFAPKYAESGYTDPVKGILFADWNVFPRNIDDILAKMGYDCEWSDEWTTCGDCGAAVRTQPDCWFWTPSYIINDGEVICQECSKP
jgi:hypothetical protein